MTALTEIFVSKMIGECYRSSATGMLIIKNGSIIKTIHFDKGNIVFASSNLPNEKLAQRLVEWGVLSRDELRETTSSMLKRHMRLGDELVTMKRIDEKIAEKLLYRTF